MKYFQDTCFLEVFLNSYHPNVKETPNNLGVISSWHPMFSSLNVVCCVTLSTYQLQMLMCFKMRNSHAFGIFKDGNGCKPLTKLPLWFAASNCSPVYKKLKTHFSQQSIKELLWENNHSQQQKARLKKAFVKLKNCGLSKAFLQNAYCL